MADNLFVNRDGVTYQLDLEKRNMLEPTDLLLVNRDGVTYTITGDEIGFPDIEVTKGVISPSDDVEEGDTLTGTATYSNAVEPVTLVHKWYVDGVQVAETSNSLDGASYFERDQEVYVEVTPNDGLDVGVAMASSTITIDNTAPVAPTTVSLTPAAPTATVCADARVRTGLAACRGACVRAQSTAARGAVRRCALGRARSRFPQVCY